MKKPLSAKADEMPPEVPFDWRNPDYAPVFEERKRRLAFLRANPDHWDPVKALYKDNPAKLIADWGMTFDPRNPEVGLPANVPFLLFPRQVEFVDWLVDRWRRREDGLVEKSRDMGVSWLCAAVAAWMYLFHPGTVVGFGSRKEEYVDKLGDPKSLFWKIRHFLNCLPPELLPPGWAEKTHAPYMRIVNPGTGAAIVGEAGDNIGRGARTSVYLKDESAFYEHAEAIEAALSQTSNCKIDVSTPNGVGNPFYRKRHGGKIPVFVFDWRDDPRKDEDWYREQCAKLDPVVVAAEIDRSYEASVANAFIPAELVHGAAMRGPAQVAPMGGLRVGVDVARFGDDRTVISFRRGRVLLRQVVLAKLDVVQVSTRVRSEVSAYGTQPEQIAVDTIGIGAGVADILRGWFPPRTDRATGRSVPIVVDVNSSLRMDDGENYNLRAYMWRELREWLKTASIPNDGELLTDLTALQYKFKGGELLLESKEDAKKRGIKSPDRGDSLAMTFAIPSQPPPRKTPIQPAFRPVDAALGALG